MLCFFLHNIKIILDKKVLLRERKRHTAHRVASIPYVVLTGYPPGQGTPPARVPPWPGYPPARVSPPARVPPQPGYPPWPGYPPNQGTPPGQGTPQPGYPPWSGYPPKPGYPPRPGYPPWPGYPPGQGTPLDLAGYPPWLDLAGYPPPAAPWHSGKCCKALWDMGTPLWTDRIMEGQTRVKTLPSRRTTYAGGKNSIQI